MADKSTESKPKISRRDFLKLAGVGSMAAWGLFNVDIFVFRGFVTKHLVRAISDQAYREKLLNTIAQGRFFSKLRTEIDEQLISYEGDCSLGEPLEMKEDILEQGFKKYEVRSLVEGDKLSNKWVMVATLGDNIGVFRTVRTPKDRYNLTQTMIEQGSCFTIPSAYVTLDSGGGGSLSPYSAYDYDGQIISYAEGQRGPAPGAIILNNDRTIRVVDKSEISSYEVGKNCKTIQSYGVAVNSDTLAEDLKNLNMTVDFTGGNAARSRYNTCFMVTLSNIETGQKESLLLSVYQHYDFKSSIVKGDEWKLGLSIEQAIGICWQLALERKSSKFVMVGPDPNYIHSRINGPIIMKGNAPQNSVLRRFGYWTIGPVFKETDDGPFRPPFFLGAKLS